MADKPHIAVRCDCHDCTGIRRYGQFWPPRQSVAGRADGIRAALEIAERARLNRPDKPRGSSRRRCGDVIRWKANNGAVDQIIGDLRRLISEGEQPAYLDGRRVDQLKAPDLKALIVDAGLAGYLTTAEAEDLIQFYGLANV
jgi:hypothetical protein